MRRPTRTGRLSIAAMASLLAFVVVAGASIRSLWTWDLFALGTWQGIAIGEGRIVYLRSSGGGRTGHISGSIYDEHASVPWGISGFYLKKISLPQNAFNELSFVLAVPLWPLFALLLIAPVRWLIARLANAPPFPVVTNQP